jgi:zinc-ribbon domain
MGTRFCTRCGQALPTNATTCPRCNAAVPAAAASVAPEATAAGATGPTPSARRACANCRAQMRWIGHYSLRATGASGAGPTGGETAETLLPFSLYYCQACGKFDFFYPGT